MREKYWARLLKKYEIAPMLAPGMVLDGRASIAMQLVEHWGMVAGSSRKDDAEGSTDPGLRLLTPKEVVARAFEVADLFIAECEQRGAIIIPKIGHDISQEEPPIAEANSA